MSNHTSAPWQKQLDADGTWFVVVPHRFFGTVGVTVNVLEIEFHAGSEADVDLVAAAPELLEACEALIAYRDKAGPLNFQLEKADDYIRMMRLAVEKAEHQ